MPKKVSSSDTYTAIRKCHRLYNIYLWHFKKLRSPRSSSWSVYIWQEHPSSLADGQLLAISSHGEDRQFLMSLPFSLRACGPHLIISPPSWSNLTLGASHAAPPDVMALCIRTSAYELGGRDKKNSVCCRGKHNRVIIIVLNQFSYFRKIEVIVQWPDSFKKKK